MTTTLLYVFGLKLLPRVFKKFQCSLPWPEK